MKLKDLLKTEGILDKISDKYGDFRINKKFAVQPGNKDPQQQIYQDLRTFLYEYFDAPYEHDLELEVRKMSGILAKHILPNKGV